MGFPSLEEFSGVPIFLLITGIFIPMSWEHNPNFRQYIANRFLRIYPEMWIAILLGVGLMFCSGFKISASFGDFALYLASYMVYPQYTPDYLRAYGTSCLNGALWLIPVQFSFYLLLPLLWKLFRGRFSVRNIVLVFAAFVAVKAALEFAFAARGLDYSSPVYKIYWYSIFVHFPMLCFGMLIYAKFELFKRIVQGRFFIFLGLHLGLYFLLKFLGCESTTLAWSNSWAKYPLMFSLAMCVFSFAYSFNGFFGFLRKYDISYPMFILHIPVANFFLYKFGNTAKIGCVSILITLFLSFLMKFYIEDYLVKFKKNSMRG